MLKTEDAMRVLRTLLACAAAAGFLILSPAAKAATPCDATMSAHPGEDQVTSDSDTRIKVWGVNFDTQVGCAKVYFDLTVTETLFDGEEITVTERTWRKTSTLGETFKVNHTIAKDSTLSDWKFKVVQCVVCGTE